MQEDVSPERVVEIVEKLRKGEKSPVSIPHSTWGLGVLELIGFVCVAMPLVYVLTSLLYLSMALKILNASRVDQKVEIPVY